MKKNLILIILISVLSCKKQQNEGFHIEAFVQDVPDSTKVFLLSGKPIDTALVINNKFSFKGNVNTKKYAIIGLYSVREFIPFWLENSHIKIEGKKGDLVNSKISGSSSQDLENELKLKSDKINKVRKSLGKKFDDSDELATKDSLLLQIDKVRIKEDEILKDFIQQNTNTMVALHKIKSNMKRWGKATTENLFEKVPEDLKKTEYGNEISTFIESSIELEIGDKFIDFTQSNTKGDSVIFSSLMKKFTLIDFWGSWCVPCRKQNPNLVKIYNKYKGKGFEIVGIGAETKKENWLNAIEKDKLPWTNLSDLKGTENEISKLYNVWVYPYNVLINEKGVIVAKHLTITQLDRFLADNFL